MILNKYYSNFFYATLLYTISLNACTDNKLKNMNKKSLLNRIGFKFIIQVLNIYVNNLNNELF